MIKLLKMVVVLTFVWGATVFAQSQTPSTDALGDNLMPMSFVKIKAGKFMMGSPDGTGGTVAEKDRSDNEVPHEVILTHDFEMQVTDVTQGQWYQVLKEAMNVMVMSIQSSLTPSSFSKPENCPGGSKKVDQSQICPNHPVENVSWFDAVQFANQYSILKHLKPCYIIKDGNVTIDAPGGNIYECVGYRLPTEAEWEYAARAGTTTAYSFGNDASLLPDYGVYYQNNPGNQNNAQPAEVGSLAPNPWGLYDMHGEMWQWTQDWYGDYPRGTVTDPTGPSTGSYRVIRGGSWNYDPQNLRSASRDLYDPANRYFIFGFRLVRTPKK